MSNYKLPLLVGAILTLTFATSGAATPALDDPAMLGAFVDGIVKPLMATNNSPSGTVAIAKDGELIFAKGYGFEDIAEQKPVDPYTTLFRPGSVSKLFTWVAVMQLVEQGRLDLDTDVNTYLKEVHIKETFDAPITLRHILTHTAGFEDGGFGYLIINDPANAIPLREAMKRYQPERVNPPGIQTAYSNYATSLAGLIVENLSGEPFSEYVKKHILEPLGMEHSSFEEPLPEGLREHMAKSYTAEGGAYVEKPFEIISNFAPAGALSATSVDMLRFAQAMLNGGELDGNRILSAATVEQTLTRNFSQDDRLMGMLLGFYETDYNGSRIIGHGGDTQWFHSFLGFDRDKDLAIFVSFGGPGGSAVRSAFVPAIYNEFFPRDEEPPVPPQDFAERAGKYAGTYGFWRGNFSTIEKAFSIGSVIKIAPTKDNTLVVAFAGKTKQYAEVDENLFREVDAGLSLAAGISPRLIAFQENDAGAITGFVFDGLPFMSARKLPPYATPSFNYALVGLSFVVLLLFFLRRVFQRREIALMAAPDRTALNAAFYASSAHWLVVVLGAVVISMVMNSLMDGLPTSFKLWLILPIIACLLSLYLAYRCFRVWQQGLLSGVWARIRYTLVTLSALALCWFYWYWNILGFQYLA
ncbi:MAG TPA: serine hydrolase domain-containing protein [Woeseiaceae bacterium]|nr:serine hydrolase domain-containing protein [Woeseiaceae bacterium]